MAEKENQKEPDIHVDEEWKKKVQEEKEQIREQKKKKETGPQGGRAFPKPNIQIFMAGLYTQTLMALGGLENPATGQRQPDLEEAEYLIDTIAMLQEKTQGSLEAEEQGYVQNILTDLRMRYVHARDADKETPPPPQPQPPERDSSDAD